MFLKKKSASVILPLTNFHRHNCPIRFVISLLSKEGLCCKCRVAEQSGLFSAARSVA